MRTLDDFAFVKDAGFVNVYDSINDTLSLYDKVPLRIYCEEYRNPLDCAIYAVYYLANIKDAVVPKGLSGDNIGRLKQIMPEEIFIKTGGWELLSNLNSTCAPYHHSSGWPPESEWNKDAEKCYELMVEICHWLVAFKENISKYLAENGPINWKEILEKKKEAFKALPENNCAASTFQPEFLGHFLTPLGDIEKYKTTLKKELEFYYNRLFDAVSAFVQGFDINAWQMPDDLVEQLPEMNRVIRLLPKVAATAHVGFYDCIIHHILFDHDWTLEKLNASLSNIELIPSDDIFKGLLCVNSYAVQRAINALPCSRSQVDSLLTAFMDKNERSFTNSLNKLSCDILPLHRLASLVPFLIKRDYGAIDNREQAFDWAIASESMYLLNSELHTKMSVIRDSGEPFTHESEDKSEPFWESFVSMMKQVIIGFVEGFTVMTESDDWHCFFPFEKKYYLELLSDEDFKYCKVALGIGGTNSSQLDKTHIDVSIELPGNLFSGAYPRDAKNTGQHFNVDYDIEQYGGVKFALLINTIISWGLVSSVDANKLVYILSGRLRPDNYNGDGIEWIDNGYGYELLYVIKYIIGNEKGKYEKARKLFHGPQWLGKGDFKDQADYADAAFRRALNAIYPEVCIIKGHVETVREPIRESGGFHIPDNPTKS